MKSTLCLLLTLFCFFPALNKGMAENAPGTVRKFKDMLKAVPSKDFGQLYGSKKVEASMAMSKLIAAKELNKEGTFRGTVTSIEPWPFPALGVTGWRIAVEDSLDQRGVNISVWVWVQVHTDPNGVIPKIKVGKEITVTGKVTRAEFVASAATPRLNVDLAVPAMSVQK